VVYTLMTPQGRIFTFFLRTVADQFQRAYGGVVFDQQILDDTKSTQCYN